MRPCDGAFEMGGGPLGAPDIIGVPFIIPKPSCELGPGPVGIWLID
jgi:hypothetical protein